jgi:WD40 repeat protein
VRFGTNKLDHVGSRGTPVFSPDAQTIALFADTRTKGAPADFDNSIRLIDIMTQKVLLSHKVKDGLMPTCLDFNPAGTLFAYSRMWDYAKGDPVDDANMVYIVKTATGKIIHRLVGHKSEVMALAFSPDGKRLATGDDDTKIALWVVTTGKRLQTVSGGDDLRLCTLKFSPDGKRLAVGGDHCDNTIWNLETGKVGETFGEAACLTLGITYSTDGKRLATANQSNLVILSDAVTGKILTRLMHTELIGDVAFDPAHGWIAAGGGVHYGQVIIWSADGSEKLKRFRGHEETVMSLAFWPDGKRLSSAGPTDVIVWDMQAETRPPAEGLPSKPQGADN